LNHQHQQPANELLPQAEIPGGSADENEEHDQQAPVEPEVPKEFVAPIAPARSCLPAENAIPTRNQFEILASMEGGDGAEGNHPDVAPDDQNTDQIEDQFYDVADGQEEEEIDEEGAEIIEQGAENEGESLDMIQALIDGVFQEQQAETEEQEQDEEEGASNIIRRSGRIAARTEPYVPPKHRE
jgi:hypothetical protein